MQITLPENATHIVICTATNERKEIKIPIGTAQKVKKELISL